MGYSTDFYGFWTLTPALSLAQTDYLQKFSRTRRVKRDLDPITDRRLAASRWRSLSDKRLSIYHQEANRVCGVSAGLTIKAIDWSTMAEKNSMNMSNGLII
jgi:hypothetical protein